MRSDVTSTTKQKSTSDFKLRIQSGLHSLWCYLVPSSWFWMVTNITYNDYVYILLPVLFLHICPVIALKQALGQWFAVALLLRPWLSVALSKYSSLRMLLGSSRSLSCYWCTSQISLEDCFFVVVSKLQFPKIISTLNNNYHPNRLSKQEETQEAWKEKEVSHYLWAQDNKVEPQDQITPRKMSPVLT